MNLETTARRPVEPATEPRPGPLSSRPWLVVAVPTLAALAITLWQVGSASIWRDEAVTVEVARFSLGDTFRVLGNIDAVHTLHYLLIHFVVRIFGDSETAIRMPSVLGAVAAAAGTAALGRRLAGPGVGLLAGLFVATSPIISRFAHESRSYAIICGLAVWTTYLLVRAVDRGTVRAFAGYGALLALMGLVHMFALLILPAHAAAVWSQGRRLRAWWAVAVAAACVLITPIAVVSVPQRDQLDWIASPTLRDVRVLLASFAGSTILVLPIAALAVFGLWRGTAERSPVNTRLLIPVWIVLPPAVLLVASLFHPYYVFRYVLICVPAVGIAVALGLARLPLRPLIAVGAALTLLTIPSHLDFRKQSSRMDDIRRGAQILRENKRPGDAIVFHRAGYRRTEGAYPDAFKGLRDLSLLRPAAEFGNLHGEDTSVPEFLRRLSTADRVWFSDNYVVPGSRGKDGPLTKAKAKAIQKSGRFRLIKRWKYQGGTLYLYERTRR